MKVLMHYTTHSGVYENFNKHECTFTNKNQIVEIENFYSKYRTTQKVLLFIVCYTCELNEIDGVIYLVGKIFFKDNIYRYKKVSEELKHNIINDLSINKINTYEKDIYYKEYTLNNDNSFYDKEINDYSKKIKLKYYDWEDLVSNNEILHSKLIDMIFDKNNVLRIASTYSPKNSYTSKIINKKYSDALTEIGFIAKNGVNVSRKTLHGDIGEFLMHLLISDFIKSEGIKKYIYPKLVFKTNPLMPVYGNDGTLYIPDKKEIYFMEAKFYKSLDDAISEAVSSLLKHNQISKEHVNHKVELFRNIQTNHINEIVEITDDVKENLILFVICGDKYKEKDVKDCIDSNKNIRVLRSKEEIIVFILPILNKSKFLENFMERSEKEWVKINEEK